MFENGTAAGNDVVARRVRSRQLWEVKDAVRALPVAAYHGTSSRTSKDEDGPAQLTS